MLNCWDPVCCLLLWSHWYRIMKQTKNKKPVLDTQRPPGRESRIPSAEVMTWMKHEKYNFFTPIIGFDSFWCFYQFTSDKNPHQLNVALTLFSHCRWVCFLLPRAVATTCAVTALKTRGLVHITSSRVRKLITGASVGLCEGMTVSSRPLLCYVTITRMCARFPCVLRCTLGLLPGAHSPDLCGANVVTGGRKQWKENSKIQLKWRTQLFLQQPLNIEII